MFLERAHPGFLNTQQFLFSLQKNVVFLNILNDGISSSLYFITELNINCVCYPFKIFVFNLVNSRPTKPSSMSHGPNAAPLHQIYVTAFPAHSTQHCCTQASVEGLKVELPTIQIRFESWILSKDVVLAVQYYFYLVKQLY